MSDPGGRSRSSLSWVAGGGVAAATRLILRTRQGTPDRSRIVCPFVRPRRDSNISVGSADGCGFISVGSGRDAATINLIPTSQREVPTDVLELWAHVAVRGELGPNGEFHSWDEPMWERKRQELAAIPPHPDLPFPDYVTTDKFHWLRAEYTAADTKDKLRLATELLRRAEANGDKIEAVWWRAETERLSPKLAPPPREKK